MPRYLVEAHRAPAAARDRATSLVARRFPEIEVEHAYALTGADESAAVWVCRAPSEEHVRRWAAATDLALAAVRRVDADVQRAEEQR